ncbi:toxin-antitoxin system TumE family protein [Castellaniella sp.]|uniref:toxin-antitoxin system TumE family protein n=1 Tax=Castellaniella sp. TaxID=1955812 RepID=UPI003C709E45
MKATLITHHRSVDDTGGIIEMVIWQVPQAIPPTTHGFKYRLVYVKNGRRVIGFDNERGKGDHMHLGQVEQQYAFTSIDQLIEDFIAEVASIRDLSR